MDVIQFNTQNGWKCIYKQYTQLIMTEMMLTFKALNF